MHLIAAHCSVRRPAQHPRRAHPFPAQNYSEQAPARPKTARAPIPWAYYVRPLLKASACLPSQAAQRLPPGIGGTSSGSTQRPSAYAGGAATQQNAPSSLAQQAAPSAADAALARTPPALVPVPRPRPRRSLQLATRLSPTALPTCSQPHSGPASSAASPACCLRALCFSLDANLLSMGAAGCGTPPCRTRRRCRLTRQWQACWPAIALKRLSPLSRAQSATGRSSLRCGLAHGSKLLIALPRSLPPCPPTRLLWRICGSGSSSGPLAPHSAASVVASTTHACAPPRPCHQRDGARVECGVEAGGARVGSGIKAGWAWV